ncbi:MAG: tyrosine-type recombinase/integrase [Dermatophilaceae bacterium]|jgi:integrase
MAHVTRDSVNDGWLARWRDPAGQQRKKSFARRVDAQRWLDQMLADLHRGRYIDPVAAKAMTGTYAEQWASGLAHLKVSTATRYRGIVRVHIVPHWGTWQLGKITLSDVNAWIADLAAGGLRPGSVRQTHRVLSLILDTAVADGRIARNPAAGAKLPRRIRAEPVFLTAQQVAELAQASKPHDLPVLTLAFTGLRFGELAGLKVKRFDPLRRRLTVSESVTEVGGRLTWSTPKTHQTRSVPVPPTLATRIEELVKGRNRDDPIFTAPDGGVLRIGNWRVRVFDPARDAAGLGDLTPHDLRHTAASLAIASGANVKAVQRMLGHASAAMTLDVYAGLFGDDLDAVADALDSLVPGHVPGDQESD